jgi:hypothetical protein
MDEVDSVPIPTAPAWLRSSHSGAQGNCVELARVAGDRVAVRDSHQPDGPALLLPRAGLLALLSWLDTRDDTLAGAEA